eukprot:gene35237-47360_t
MNVPHPAVFQANIVANPAQRRKSWYVLFFQIPWLPEWALTARGAQAIGRAFSDMAVDKSRFSEADLDHYRRNALKPGAATAMVNWYRAGARNGMKKWAPGKAPVIDIPTLMIWGEEDTALGIELTEGYEPYVNDFTLHRLPGVSHWVQQEAPEAVNARLEAWLEAKGLALYRPWSDDPSPPRTGGHCARGPATSAPINEIMGPPGSANGRPEDGLRN